MDAATSKNPMINYLSYDNLISVLRIKYGAQNHVRELRALNYYSGGPQYARCEELLAKIALIERLVNRRFTRYHAMEVRRQFQLLRTYHSQWGEYRERNPLRYPASFGN